MTNIDIGPYRTLPGIDYVRLQTIEPHVYEVIGSKTVNLIGAPTLAIRKDDASIIFPRWIKSLVIVGICSIALSIPMSVIYYLFSKQFLIPALSSLLIGLATLVCGMTAASYYEKRCR
jgi:hypothetical protein